MNKQQFLWQLRASLDKYSVEEVDGLKIAKQIINGGAAKKLRAETSNGSINIDFL